MDEQRARLMRFVLEMRQAGVTDARALAALERTPRTHYAPPHLEGLAMDDMALPLAGAQVMTKPSLVGRMIAALGARDTDTVLEIGTGSGFQAACLATMANKIVTLDRLGELVSDARARFGVARLMRVFAHNADGFEGWADGAMYDRIILNAGLFELPEPLLAQLKPGGVLVAPLGPPDAQRLVRLRESVSEDLGPVKFQMLERGVA
jgi:protein-L-isoaspartate(D-aspartate) O-methyltransferase